MKTTKLVFLSLFAASFLIGCANNNPSDGEGGKVLKGTYTRTFTTEEISGNVRHTGYLSALNAREVNTIVLGDNNTYTYTKLVTTAEASSKAIRKAYREENAILFSWTSAGDGACSLDFLKDGTYEFQYSAYSVSEVGTWKCENFQMSVTTPKGNVMTPTMDATTHAFSFTYTADAGGGRLTHPFKVESSVWGAAIGQSGTYVVPSEDPLLFSWTSAGDGACSLDFLKDGTYEFQYSAYSVSEVGTWKCENFQMSVTTPKGNVMTPTMDATTHAFSFTYTADAGGGRLTHPFKVESSVWGAAIGQSGTYVPPQSGEEEAKVTCSHYYAGSGKQTSGGVEFDVKYELFLLSDGKLILQVSSGGATQYMVGSYEGAQVTIGTDVINVTSQTEIVYNGIKLTKADLPATYADTDFAELYKKASTPVSDGPVVLTYVFTGKFVDEGNNRVTLQPATAVTWKEDWGKLQARGFTNCEGDKDGKVLPKGESGDYFLPLDHFGSDFLYAPAYATDVENAEVTYNYKRTVKLNDNGSFEYEPVQSSDDD